MEVLYFLFVSLKLFSLDWGNPSTIPGPKLKLFKIRFRLNEDKMQNKKRF